MSLLRDLLQAKDRLFDLTLKQLEDLTDHQGVDTALIGEILGKTYDRAQKMGLDPGFNGKELYYSLINHVKTDDERLAKAIGGRDPSSVPEMLPLIVKRVKKVDMPKSGWFLKESVARKMLKNFPPPNTMKRLGYTDFGRMMAKENLYEVYGALRFAEEADWLNKFIEQYKSLTFDDFTHRDIQIIGYDPDKWGDIAAHFIAKKLHNITHLKELGVVMIMPTGSLKVMTGLTLKVLPLLIHYLYEVRLYSAFFKLISLKSNFGQLLVGTLIADTAHTSVLDGKHKVHWRVIQRYLGKHKEDSFPEMFQPHVQPEDLHWRKAEEVLYDIDPAMEFWKGMDFVGWMTETGPVVFNLMDVSLSYSNKVDYPGRYIYHFRESLWNEIFVRYMGQKVLENEILHQLDNELIAPEKIVTNNK